jgi:hypothetical protein
MLPHSAMVLLCQELQLEMAEIGIAEGGAPQKTFFMGFLYEVPGQVEIAVPLLNRCLF